MKVKIGLFVLVFVVFLLMPTVVFAQQTKAKCNNYGSYRWYGYTIVANGQETNMSVSGSESISDYFNSRFKSGEIDTKGITGIWLFFSDSEGKQYSSKASLTWPGKRIQCTGKVDLIQGTTVDPSGGDNDPGTIHIISTYRCSDLQNTDLYIRVLNPAYKFVRIAVPCLLVLLCSYDFMSAVVANDQDKMKKAQSRVFKRIVVGIIIFVLPNLLNALLNLFGTYGTCGIGM